jgi:hypothetical protein
MPGPHDIGGQILGSIDRSEHVPTDTERTVDAMQMLMGASGRKTYRIDEMRRAIESLSPEDYANFAYYNKWARAMSVLVVEKGILTESEISDRISSIRAEGMDNVGAKAGS